MLFTKNWTRTKVNGQKSMRVNFAFGVRLALNENVCESIEINLDIKRRTNKGMEKSLYPINRNIVGSLFGSFLNYFFLGNLFRRRALDTSAESFSLFIRLGLFELT